MYVQGEQIREVADHKQVALELRSKKFSLISIDTSISVSVICEPLCTLRISKITKRFCPNLQQLLLL